MKKRIVNVVILIWMCAFLFALAGCLSDSTDSSNDVSGSTEQGQLTISLTDAPGDFIHYSVNVTSIQLTKANGATVETLPLTTTVDFAQYMDLSEFLTVGTIPSGKYTQVSMILDYTDADIWVEDQNGDVVSVDNIQDQDGNPIGTMEVSVSFNNSNALVIAPGIPSHLALDFNLSASNQVTYDAQGIPVVSVDPTLQADVNLETTKPYRVRGPLKSVDLADNSFTLILRPFYFALTGHNERFGAMKAIATEETIFEINGQSYQGLTGLTALNDLERLLAVVVTGNVKYNPLRIEATEVLAGSSVPGGTMDAVSGNVISRNGDTFVLKGATLIRMDGHAIFNDQVEVQIGPDTQVTRQLSTDAFTSQDISVGQKVTVFGTISSDTPTDLTMDASQGAVRMFLTTLRGQVVNTDPAQNSSLLILDLQSVDMRQINLFDFQGTGIDVDHDADPQNYEIDAGALDVTGLNAHASVKLRGFVTPFGQAPLDFTAQTIVNVSNIMAILKVTWNNEAQDAFTGISDQSLMVNLENTSRFHHVSRGHVATDLNDLQSAPVIVPDADGQGLYSIQVNRTMSVYTTFASFIEDLTAMLADQQYFVHTLSATGYFDDATATLTSKYIQVKLK